MKQKFGKGVSVKIKNGYRIPLTQARPTYSAFIMNVPAGPWAGASDLHLEAGAVGEIDSIAHGEFQGWYVDDKLSYSLKPVVPLYMEVLVEFPKREKNEPFCARIAGYSFPHRPNPEVDQTYYSR